MKQAGKPFRTESIPETGLDRDSALALIAAAGDIALVVDGQGVIRDVATADGGELPATEVASWIGRPWIDTVAAESRATVAALLREVASRGASRRRQLYQSIDGGMDAPISYMAVRLNGASGGFVAVGRDLRAIASLQQRLVETQQVMERDYGRLRHVETRYRLLFQLSIDAILVVDAGSRRVVDINDAAARLFGRTLEKLVGKTFPLGVDAESEPLLDDALVAASAAGRSDTVQVRILHGDALVQVSVSCFRQDVASLFLVRFASATTEAPHGGESSSDIAELVASTPDGFVVTDIEGRVLSANRAFLDLAQLTGERQAHGRLISEWIGRPGADLGVFLATLKKHGAVRLMTTAVQGEQGGSSEAEVSAAATSRGGPQRIGFVVRDVSRRFASGPQGARDLTGAVEQLTTLVGQVALRDLLRDTTDLVERHFIQAALELTDDNRTAAAEVLGLSRQSLYVKMRRHELGTGVEAAEARQAG